jgi:hypothetical protein
VSICFVKDFTFIFSLTRDIREYLLTMRCEGNRQRCITQNRGQNFHTKSFRATELDIAQNKYNKHSQFIKKNIKQ